MCLSLRTTEEHLRGSKQLLDMILKTQTEGQDGRGQERRQETGLNITIASSLLLLDDICQSRLCMFGFKLSDDMISVY